MGIEPILRGIESPPPHHAAIAPTGYAVFNHLSTSASFTPNIKRPSFLASSFAVGDFSAYDSATLYGTPRTNAKAKCASLASGFTRIARCTASCDFASAFRVRRISCRMNRASAARDFTLTLSLCTSGFICCLRKMEHVKTSPLRRLAAGYGIHVMFTSPSSKNRPDALALPRTGSAAGFRRPESRASSTPPFERWASSDASL